MSFNTKEKKADYRKQYNYQYRLDNKEYFRQHGKQWRLDNKEHRKQYDEQYYIDNKEKLQVSDAVRFVKFKYGLTKEMWIKLYEKQGGLCLGCDIKLISSLLPEERKQYEDDPNLIRHVDYNIAQVDHDHSFDIDGKPSGNLDSVRGLLCNSCNTKDVLDPESDHYIYGDDPTVKETLIKNRETNIILKQWHKEEN